MFAEVRSTGRVFQAFDSCPFAIEELNSVLVSNNCTKRSRVKKYDVVMQEDNSISVHFMPCLFMFESPPQSLFSHRTPSSHYVSPSYVGIIITARRRLSANPPVHWFLFCHLGLFPEIQALMFSASMRLDDSVVDKARRKEFVQGILEVSTMCTLRRETLQNLICLDTP